MLTTAHLTAMQAVQNTILPGTAIIQRYSETDDGMGNTLETWANVGTANCRLMPQVNRRMEGVAGGQEISETLWYVTMPVGTVVTAKDRLKIGNRTFQITEVNNSQSYQTAVRCDCTAFNEELRV